MYIYTANDQRPMVRYKAINASYLGRNKTILPSNPDQHKAMQNFASYSQLAYLSSMNQEGQRRLYELGSSACEPYVYYPGLGFKTFYKGRSRACAEDNMVYVVEYASMKSLADPARERIFLSRFKREEVEKANYWPQELSFTDKLERLARYDQYREVFVDRLKKAEIAKLHMMTLMPANRYLEGFGMVFERTEGDRKYFMEVG
mgnify:FL=1